MNLMIMVTIQATSLILPRGELCLDSEENGNDWKMAKEGLLLFLKGSYMFPF